MIYFILLLSALCFADDYSLYMNKEGQFDLEARIEIDQSAEFQTVSDLIKKGFHAEEIQLKLNQTEDFEIREQKYSPDGGGLKLTTKSCKKKVLWFCKELEFNCEVSMTDSSYKQICRLDFDQKDAKTVFDKSFNVVNTLECSLQAGKFFCTLKGQGLSRETLLVDSRQLAVGGSTETFRGFFQLKEFFNRKNSAFPDPVQGSKDWQSYYNEAMECSKKHQAFKILGKMSPSKRTCLEVPMK